MYIRTVVSLRNSRFFIHSGTHKPINTITCIHIVDVTNHKEIQYLSPEPCVCPSLLKASLEYQYIVCYHSMVPNDNNIQTSGEIMKCPPLFSISFKLFLLRVTHEGQCFSLSFPYALHRHTE